MKKALLSIFSIGLLGAGLVGQVRADSISRGTELRVRLHNEISTDTNEEGDRFTATVLSPSRYEGAVVRGSIANIDRSGKLKGKTRMRLKFDRIQFTDRTSAPFSADIVQVYESDFEDAGETDEEGAVESGSQSKEALLRGGLGAAAGAIIGGLAGGKKGAAIGVLIGAGAGVGSVLVSGEKELELEAGSEMLIRAR